MRDQIAGQSRPSADKFLVVVQTDARRDFQLITDVVIGLTKQAIGFYRQQIGVVAEKWRAQIRWRQTSTKRSECTDNASEIVDTKTVYVITVLAQL